MAILAPSRGAARPLDVTGTLPYVSTMLDLLERWIARSVTPDRLDWYRRAVQTVRDGARLSDLGRAIGLAPRTLGRGDLIVTDHERREADALRPGFDPTGLSIDQAARIGFVLASYKSDESFAQTVETLCRTADLQELLCYYRGLAVFPAPALLRARASEGLRSAIRPVFEAVAHRNPYPREMLDDAAWNQMVLKALFIGSTLFPIQGLDERANPELAEILIDYAHERWAAGRPVSLELWRCVGPFAGDRALQDMERVLATGAREERAAVLLALDASSHPRAREMIANSTDLKGLALRGWADLIFATRSEQNSV
jgi:hypothetical protein